MVLQCVVAVGCRVLQCVVAVCCCSKLFQCVVAVCCWSALPEELEWNNRAEDVALSVDAIKRCLINMLVALDRDTPQTKKGLALSTNSLTQEPLISQELPWLWFMLPELGFPSLMDQYRRPLHPEIEE